jgi:hypothetical protein
MLCHAMLAMLCYVAKDDELLVLGEKLQTTQLELKVGGASLGSKNEELLQELGHSIA